MKLKKILAAIAACAMSAAMISMTVSAAGVAGDDETLDDSTEVGDDISLDEDEGDDEVVDTGDEDEGDDEVVDNGEEDTQAPAQTTPNPTTGNSPIALAVIPVALAAAAVVAKKAK